MLQCIQDIHQVFPGAWVVHSICLASRYVTTRLLCHLLLQGGSVLPNVRLFLINSCLSSSIEKERSTITIGREPHACIEIENHATLFSWSIWLAEWIAGGGVRPTTKIKTKEPHRTK